MFSSTPKTNSMYAEVARKQGLRSVNMSMYHQLTSAKDLRRFYGTDVDSRRDKYSSTIFNAIKTRVVEPVADCVAHPRDYFFKPYFSFGQAWNQGVDGPVCSTLLVTSALGVFGDLYTTIALICLPAVIEWIAGLVSLAQASYFAGKSVLTKNATDMEISKEYLLDATTRFALVIPMAVVSMVALPFEAARFFTQIIETLTNHLSEKKSSLSDLNMDPQAEDVASCRI